MTFQKHTRYQSSQGVEFEYIGTAPGRFESGQLVFMSVKTGQLVNFNADGTHPTIAEFNLIKEQSHSVKRAMAR